MYPYPYGGTEILLDVGIAGDDITVRIDKDSLGQGEYQGLPVTELVLSGCRNATRDFETLSESLGDGVAYQVTEHGVTLSPDFAPAFTVACDRVSEIASDYTISDLKKKCAWLGEHHIGLLEKYEDISRKYSSTMSRMEAEITKEIDRCQRKMGFSRESKPEKARELSARVEALRRFLSFMR